LVIGHSTGEVAAAYMAQLLSIDEAICTAITLGTAGASFDGAMVHAHLTPAEVDACSDGELCIATVDGVVRALNTHAASELLSVTLCGPLARAETWLASRPDAERLAPPHPWHHPMYLGVPGIRDGSALATLPESRAPGSDAAMFLSAITAEPVRRLDAAYWRTWLATRVDFKGALERAALRLGGECCIIETGAHPKLTPVAIETLGGCGVRVVAAAASMRVGQPDEFWQVQQPCT